MMPPISIWEDMRPKWEKIAENCIFFFDGVRFCHVWCQFAGVVHLRSSSQWVLTLAEAPVWGCYLRLFACIDQKREMMPLWLGDFLVRAWPARAFPGLLHFLLSQPSQHPSFGEINGGWKNVIWKGWKYGKRGWKSLDNSWNVKICPKCACYLLINRWLHENRWRLWKQKVQNCCSVRARARARGMLESLFNSGWFHSLGEVSWRCCNFLRRI